MRQRLLFLLMTCTFAGGMTTFTYCQESSTSKTKLDRDSARQLQEVIQAEFPNANVRLRPLHSSIIVSGSVETPEISQQIVQVAEDYYPKVINNIDTEYQPADTSLQLKIIKLSRLPADKAASTIKQLFDEYVIQGLRLEAHPDLNALIMRGRPELVSQLSALLNELDAASPTSHRDTTNPSSVAGPLTEQVVTAEQQVLNDRLADLRDQYHASAKKPSDKEKKKAAESLSKIRQLMEDAFDNRLGQQMDQVKRLQARLTTLQNRIEQREKQHSQLIDQATQELLNGERSVFPATAPRSPESTSPIQPTGGGDEFNVLLRLATQLGSIKNDVERTKKMHEKGYVSSAAVAEKELELKAANAQLGLMRGSYETAIQRTELQLRQAKVELEYATEEYAAARKSNDSSPGTIPQSQLRKLALEREQAALAVQRVELDLMEAHRQYDAFHATTVKEK